MNAVNLEKHVVLLMEQIHHCLIYATNGNTKSELSDINNVQQPVCCDNTTNVVDQVRPDPQLNHNQNHNHNHNQNHNHLPLTTIKKQS